MARRRAKSKRYQPLSPIAFANEQGWVETPLGFVRLSAARSVLDRGRTPVKSFEAQRALVRNRIGTYDLTEHQASRGIAQFDEETYIL